MCKFFLTNIIFVIHVMSSVIIVLYKCGKQSQNLSPGGCWCIPIPVYPNGWCEGMRPHSVRNILPRIISYKILDCNIENTR